MKNKQENSDNPIKSENSSDSTDESGHVEGRREAVTKLAYASPLIAGLLFSKNSAAFSPPRPPPPLGS